MSTLCTPICVLNLSDDREECKSMYTGQYPMGLRWAYDEVG
jgi:hypothetical protein